MAVLLETEQLERVAVLFETDHLERVAVLLETDIESDGAINA